MGQLDDDDVADIDTVGYLDLLDRALEDRRLTEQEAVVLAETAREWGSISSRVAQAHDCYFERLIATANADGVIAVSEHADLVMVAHLLRVDPSTIDRSQTT